MLPINIVIIDIMNIGILNLNTDIISKIKLSGTNVLLIKLSNILNLFIPFIFLFSDHVAICQSPLIHLCSLSKLDKYLFGKVSSNTTSVNSPHLR